MAVVVVCRITHFHRDVDIMIDHIKLNTTKLSTLSLGNEGT